jgi:hypothetical protein
MNDFYDNVKTDKTSTLEINDDDKSASTTDSDRLEFLKLIKKCKLEKQNKKMALNENVSNEKMKSYCSNAVFSVDGTILEASPVSTTVTRTGRMLDVQESVDLSGSRKELDENALRQTFKGVWSHLSVNGGYSLKLHYVRTPSSANYYPIVVDVTNNSGQMNIYIKGMTFIEVLKGFAHEFMKHCKDVAREVNLPPFL